jgi:threonine aldolase
LRSHLLGSNDERYVMGKTRFVDLRSDTVTKPTSGMLAAMSRASVGDDVWGDDPTVAELYRVIADLAGKEAALFFPSGTQSNLAAVMGHCRRGDEVILGRESHVYIYEAGGASVLGGVSYWPIDNAADGSLPLDAVRRGIRGDDVHFPITGLICLENTIGGGVIPQQAVIATAALAGELRVPLHLDGARLWNAAVSCGRSVADLCAPFDSVSLCFSKGLGAPAGSVLVGSAETIRKAVRLRKILGGGMRQTGLLAAACLYAMEHNVERMADDHRNAERLAAGLRQLPLFNQVRQATNMVFAAVSGVHCAGLQTFLDQAGVICAVRPSMRLVTNLGVDEAGIDYALAAFARYAETSAA